MVAIVTSNGLGLYGDINGASGNADVARNGQSNAVYVNSTTGNLVIRARDEFLAAVGTDLSLIRTYNSQGRFTDDNGDNWRLGIYRRLSPVSGTMNTEGSSVTKTFGDGAEIVYRYDAAQGLYISTAGDGAHDTLHFDAANQRWTWTDGSSRESEIYDVNGLLLSSRDADLNTTTYRYNAGGQIEQITDASGQSTFLDYNGNDLTQIRVVSQGQTQILTEYRYDNLHRLTEVRIDLTPEIASDSAVYTTVYTYDGQSTRIASITQGDGTSVAFTYEEFYGEWRVKTYTDGEGRVTTLNYSLANGGGLMSVLADTSVLANTETQTVTNEYDLDSSKLSTSGETQTVTRPHARIDSALSTTETVNRTLTLNSAALSTDNTSTYARNDAALTRRVNTNYSLRTAALTPSGASDVLQSSLPLGGVSAAAGGWAYYTIDVPAGQSELYASLRAENGAFRFDQSIGNAALYLRRGAPPTLSEHDAVSESFDTPGNGMEEALLLDNPAAGTWYVGVYGVSDFQGGTLYAGYQAGTNEVVTLTPNEAVYNINGVQGSQRAFRFDIAPGTSSFRLTLSNALNDGNIYLSQGAPVNLDSPQYATSEIPNSFDKFLELTNPTAGTWYVVVKTESKFNDARLVLRTNLGTNRPPILDPGTTFRAAPGTTVNLSGRARDFETAITALTFRWRQLSGPSVTLTNATTNSASFVAPSVTTPTRLSFEVQVTDGAGAITTDVLDVIVDAAPLGYTIPTGATWQMLSAVLYGNAANNPGAATALQAALGNIPLTPGTRLTNLPTTLTAANAQYTIPTSGATWQSIARTLYGIDSAAAGAALQAVMGNRSISPRFTLAGLPPTLTVGGTYIIPNGATWESIAGTLYGDTSAQAVAALQAVLGNPSLSSTNRLTNLPATLAYTTTLTVPPYYLIKSGDTWQSIANTLYGVDSAAAGAVLQHVAGNPPLMADFRLTYLPPTITVTTTETVKYYVIPENATWQSIAAELYGVNNKAAGDALAVALGNPALRAGDRLINLPAKLTVTTTNTLNVPPYYIVPANATWESIVQAVYGTSDAMAAAALRTMTGNPVLTEGRHLTVPLGLMYMQATGEIVTGPIWYLQTDVVDPLGGTTTYLQNGDGRLMNVLSPAVNGARSETRYVYDADGNVTRIMQDPSGANRTTTFEYDARGNLLLTRDNAGNTVTRTYSATNQLLTETAYITPDADGAGPGQPGTASTTRYIRDAAGRLRFTVSALGRVSENRYNDRGELTATLRYTAVYYTGTGSLETDLAAWADQQRGTPLERIDYTYDFRGNVSTATSYGATDANGEGIVSTASKTQFVYNQRGLLLQTIGPRGSAGTPSPANAATAYATTLTYDGLGRVLSTTQWIDSGATTSSVVTSYDDAANRVVTTVNNGANTLVTTSVYNRAGELTSIINSTPSDVRPNGMPSDVRLGTTTYAYDRNGRLRMVTDAVGVRTHVLYDAAGRKVMDIDGDGSVIEYIYNRANQVVKTIRYGARIDNGVLITAAGTPADVDIATLRTAASGAPAQDAVNHLVYDAAGRVQYTIDDVSAVTQRIYDGRSLVIETIRYAAAVSIDRSVGEILPADLILTPSTEDRHVRTFYSADGLLIGELDAEGYVTRISNNAVGREQVLSAYAQQVTDPALRESGTLDQLVAHVTAAAADVQAKNRFAYLFYDGQGREVGSLDGEGYFTERRYDLVGNLTHVLRYGRQLSYGTGLDTFQTLQAAAAAPGAAVQTTSFEYDGANRATRETNFEGTVTTYLYDSVGNLLRTTRAQGTSDVRVTQTRYNALSQVVRELSAEGSALLTGSLTQAETDLIWDRYGVTYTYDAVGRRISATTNAYDPTTQTTQTATTLYYYNEDGQLRFTVNPLGQVSETRYDALGRVTDQIAYADRIATAGLVGGLVTSALITQLTAKANAATDARTTTAYAYRASGRERREVVTTTAEGAQTTNQYDVFGDETRRMTRIDTRTREDGFAYDRRGLRVATQLDPSGINRSQADVYDAFGRLISSTDQYGNVARSEYDRLGRVIATIDPSLQKNTTTYDAYSRVLTATDALNNVTTFTYDDATRRVTIRTPEGIVTSTVRTRTGETLSVTAGGNTTTYTYDRNGNLKTVSDGLGALESRSYDSIGRQLMSTDANGVTTKFAYDAANRTLSRVVDTAGLALATTFTFDDANRTLEVRDPNGVVTRTVSDRDGRVIQVAIDPTGLNLRTTYAYNAASNVVTQTDGAGTAVARVTQYAFDVLGRRIEEVVDPGTGLNAATGRPYLNLTTRYRYDANGNVTRVIDAAGNSTWYMYDALDRLRGTVDATGAFTETRYDAENRVIGTRRYATPIATASFGDRVTSLTTVVPNIALDRLEQTVLDRDGRARYRIGPEGGVVELTYDDSGKVTRSRAYAKAVPVMLYASVAAVQNALTAAGNDLTTPSTDDRLTWTAYDARGRAEFLVDSAGAVARLRYDDNGNVIARTAFATPRATSLATDLASLREWAAQAIVADHADNRTHRYWYDGAGREVFCLDPEGYLKETRYNDAAGTTSVILYRDKPTVAADATPVQLRENAVVTGFNAARDQVTTSARDAAGRTVLVYDALSEAAASSYEAYVYDALGNRITTYDARAFELADRDSAWAQNERERLRFPARLADLTQAQRSELRARYATTRTFDAAGRELTIVDPVGGTTRKTYDARGNVVKLTDARGSSGYFYYDADGRERFHIDPRGFVTELRYDALGNKIEELNYATALTGAYSEATTLADIASRIVTDSTRDRRITRTFDQRGLVEMTTYYGTGQNYTEQLKYNTFGEKEQYTDRNGATFDYRYDTRGQLKREILPAAEIVTAVLPNVVTQTLRLENVYDYNAFGEKIALREAAGTAQERVTRYAYDHRGAEVRIEQPAVAVFSRASGATTTQTPTVQKFYDGAGNLVLEIAANGGRSVNYYDSRNLRVASVDADNVLREFEYDPVGNVVRERTYDTRLTGVQTPAAQPVPVNADDYRELQYRYNANNQRVLTQTRVETQFIQDRGYYDSAVVTLAEYDANGNVVMIQDGNGSRSYKYYDAQGNRILDVDNEGFVVRNEYSAQGQVIRETRYAGQLSITVGVGTAVDTIINAIPPGDDRITEFKYDRLGRLIEQRQVGVSHSTLDAAGRPLPVTGDLVTTLVYDGNGNQIAQIQPGAHGRIDFTYDALGRKTSQLDPQFLAFNGRGQATVATRSRQTFKYDAHGNLAVQTQVGATTAEDRETRELFDVAGRVVTRREPDGALSQYDYDINGNIVRATRNVTDVNGVAHVYRTYVTYDIVDREVSRQDVEDEGTPNQTQDIRYNAHGDIEAKGINGQFQELYRYDRLGRLFFTNKDTGKPTLYVYDANGNLTLQIQGVASDLMQVPDGETTRPLRGPADAAAFSPDKEQFLINRYNRRNELIDAFDAPMMFGDLLAAPPTIDPSGTPGAPNERDMLRNMGMFMPTGLSNPIPGTPTPGGVRTRDLPNPQPQPIEGFGAVPPSPPETRVDLNTIGYAALDIQLGEVKKPPVNLPTKDEIDGNVRTVTDVEIRETVFTEATPQYVNGAMVSVKLKITTTTDTMTRVAKFTRSMTEAYSNDEQTLTQTWVSDPDIMMMGDRKVDTREETVYVKRTTVISGEPAYEADMYPGLLTFDASGYFVIDAYDYYGEGFPQRYVGVNVSFPQPITAFGTGAMDVYVYDGSGREYHQQSFGETLYFGLPETTYAARLTLYKGGVLLYDSNVNTNGSLPAFVSLKAQSPDAEYAELRVLNGDGTATDFVRQDFAGSSAADGFELTFRGNYAAGQQYEYKVYGAGRLLNHVQGTFGASDHRNFYTATVTEQNVQYNEVTSGSATNQNGAQRVPLNQLQNNYIQNIWRTITEGAMNRHLIHRQQTFNAFGDIASQTDGRGFRTDLTYNDLGKLVRQEQPLTAVYGETAPIRPTTLYYYDELGQLISTQDANSTRLTSGNYYTSRLLVNGRVEKEFDPFGNPTVYVYDRLGNARQQFDAVGQETRFDYDLRGNLTLQTRYDLAGFEHSSDRYEYDADDNRIAHTNALGSRETYVYDGQKRIRLYTSFYGRQTHYDYNYVSTIGDIGGYEKITTTTGVDGEDTQVDHLDYFGKIRYHRDLGGHQYNYYYNNAGWLSHQTGSTAGTNRRGQDIEYKYYQNGLLAEIWDRGIDSYARFQYDNNGNRTVEGYSQVPINAGPANIQPYQLASAEYDSLNRVISVKEAGKFALTYRYDAVGNRRNVRSEYFDLFKDSSQVQDFYYKYDRANRFTVTMGQLDSSGDVVYGNTGYAIEYDALGRRASATSAFLDDMNRPQYRKEVYAYDPIDTVRDVMIYTRNPEAGFDPVTGAPVPGPNVLAAHIIRDNNALGSLRDYREFDGAGNLTKYIHYEYDADNLTTVEEDRTDSNRVEKTTYDYVGSILAKTTTGDASLTYTYEKWDTYKESVVRVMSGTSMRNWRSGDSTYQYDSNGHITKLFDSQANRTITYINNHKGQVLKRYQIDREPSGSDKPPVARNFYYLDGRGIGDTGIDKVKSRIDYAQQIAEQEKTDRKGRTSPINPQLGKRVLPVTSSDFDQNFQPINDSFPSRAAGTHIVQPGETLMSIALSMWGDSSLWYLLADANGLANNSQLTPGLVLTVPNVVTNVRNNAETFRPYNAAAALGDTTPTLSAPPPPPLKKGCNVLAAVLIAVVAIVVTVYTAGALSGLAGGNFAAGSAVLGGTAGVGVGTTIAAAAVGGLAGSIASQAVGIALGVQKGFDFKGAAIAAISSVVGAGLGKLASFAKGSRVLTTINKFATENPYTFASLNGAASSALTQGIAVGTGLQSSFSWRNVAIAAVAGPVARAFGKGAEALAPSTFAREFASNVGGALVRRAFGDRTPVRTILASALGNAIGESSVSALSEPPLGLTDEDRARAREQIEAGARAATAEAAAEVRAGLAARFAAENGGDLPFISAPELPEIESDGGGAVADTGAVPGAPEEVVVTASRLPADNSPPTALYRAQLARYLYTSSDNPRLPEGDPRIYLIRAQQTYLSEHALPLNDFLETLVGARADVGRDDYQTDNVGIVLNKLVDPENASRLLDLVDRSAEDLADLSFAEQLDVYISGVTKVVEANVKFAARTNSATINPYSDPVAARFLLTLPSGFEKSGERGFIDAVATAAGYLGPAVGAAQDTRVALDVDVLRAAADVGVISRSGADSQIARAHAESSGLADGISNLFPFKVSLFIDLFRGSVSTAEARVGQSLSKAATRIAGLSAKGLRRLTDTTLLGKFRGSVEDLLPLPLERQQFLNTGLQRAIFYRNLGESRTGFNRHHIIPLETLKEFPRLLRLAARGGFDINGKANGIFIRQADHVGGHPEYNTAVFGALKTLNKNLSRLTPQEAAARVSAIQDTLRGAIAKRTFLPRQ